MKTGWMLCVGAAFVLGLLVAKFSFPFVAAGETKTAQQFLADVESAYQQEQTTVSSVLKEAERLDRQAEKSFASGYRAALETVRGEREMVARAVVGLAKGVEYETYVETLTTSSSSQGGIAIVRVPIEVQIRGVGFDRLKQASLPPVLMQRVSQILIEDASTSASYTKPWRGSNYPPLPHGDDCSYGPIPHRPDLGPAHQRPF
ncbi:MAG TPA: hypothetical protein VEB60_02920 [Candidatus Paceibacterota bacterium]|nr:hypothetical protein [Candidatus Paceibacterota bacterium]